MDKLISSAHPLLITKFPVFLRYIAENRHDICKKYLRKHPEFVEKHELLFIEDVGELTKIKMFFRKRKKPQKQ